MLRHSTYCALVLLLLCHSIAQANEPIAVQSVVLRLLHEASAPAQRSGVLMKIDAKEGDAVQKGQVLGRLDDREARLAVRAADVELAIAQERAGNDIQVRFAAKANEVAAAELRRSEESIRSFAKSVSQSQIDVERLEVEKTALEKKQAEHTQRLAQMELRLKQAALDAAKLELEQRQILAPLSGVVVQAPVKLGEWLEPGQMAFRLVNVGRLKAEGFVTADQAANLAPGADTEVRVSGDGRAFRGKLVFISPEIDPINNQVRVWAEVENHQQQLKPGQRVEMRALPGGGE